MEKHIYEGVEYDIEVVNGKPVAVYLNGELITGPLADEIIDHFDKKRPAPTPRRPKP